ncbi:VOC family protein [Kribbella solani]|uniref:VOC family protein n=1 Tax=Kribbella solani TaxID=236067 RepID=UPI0029B6F0FA|nr:VOC family protein [Kribbella solani]MDX2974463.1 VOC family protein [Kribbella solani]
MALTLGAIILNVPKTGPAAEFWAQALNFTPAGNPDFLVPPPAARPTHLHLDDTDRTHLDLWVDPSSTIQAEVDRLLALGATRVEDWTYPPDADFVVLQSPDGTVFCLIEPATPQPPA